MKEISAGTPVDFGEAKLTPIEEKGIYCRARNGRVWCYAFKRPVRISVITPRGEVTLEIPDQEVADNERQEI